MLRTRALLLALLVGPLLCALALLATPSPASAAWVGGWWAGAQPSFGPGALNGTTTAASGTGDRSLRQVVRVTSGGSRIKLRLRNVTGRAIRVDRLQVAVSSGGVGIDTSTNRAVTFGGAGVVTVAPGETRLSDGVALAVRPGLDLAVSLWTAGGTGPLSWHRISSARSFLSSPGNHVSGSTGSSWSSARSTTGWYLLSGVSVDSPTDRGTVVAFGDSITDGYGSTQDANHRYPDVLAGRMRAAGIRGSVVNSAIAGNRLLSTSPRSTAGVDRLGPDLGEVPGARAVILLEGVNDLNFGNATADQLVAGYRRVVAAAHARGARVMGATIMPASLSAPRESVRREVNGRIRTWGIFDAVVDLDGVMRDPADRTRLRSGEKSDGVHPNDAGYRRMAGAIDLPTIRAWIG